MSDRTVVIANARRELLRCLASVEEAYEKAAAEDMAAHGQVFYPSHSPLFCSEWANSVGDIALAAREAHRLGDIELHDSPMCRLIGNGPMVRITAQGRAWIARELLLGELAHEARATPPESGA